MKLLVHVCSIGPGYGYGRLNTHESTKHKQKHKAQVKKKKEKKTHTQGPWCPNREFSKPSMKSTLRLYSTHYPVSFLHHFFPWVLFLFSKNLYFIIYFYSTFKSFYKADVCYTKCNRNKIDQID